MEGLSLELRVVWDVCDVQKARSGQVREIASWLIRGGARFLIAVLVCV